MSAISEIKSLLRLRVLQLASLLLLMTGAGALSILPKSPVRDADVWWHLKVGDWILANHAFPHTGIFSGTAGDRPWIAYAWGYEVLLSRVYAWFGLTGLAWYGIVLTVAVAWVFFWALNRMSGKFWLSWILCGIGSVGFLFNLLPRPAFFSMLLYPIMVMLILDAQRREDRRLLYWLPLVFVFWANLHVQFVYGLFVLGLYVGTNILLRLLRNTAVTSRFQSATSIAPGVLAGVFAACVVACCVGPYSYHLFQVVLGYSKSKVPYLYSQELQSLDFQHPSDYFLVIIALWALYAVVWRKKIDLFKLLLLLVAGVLGYKTLRDAWFLAISAGLFIADVPRKADDGRELKLPEFAAVAVLLAGSLFLVARNTGFDHRGLDQAITGDFPVNAVNYLRRHPARGPLYNDFGWGGFLIWYLPEYPVSIDGRNDLYGDEFDLQSFNTMGGAYTDDPYLKQAGVVLIPKDTPLASLLSSDPRFRLVFADHVSALFVRN